MRGMALRGIWKYCALNNKTTILVYILFRILKYFKKNSILSTAEWRTGKHDSSRFVTSVGQRLHITLRACFRYFSSTFRREDISLPRFSFPFSLPANPSHLASCFRASDLRFGSRRHAANFESARLRSPRLVSSSRKKRGKRITTGSGNEATESSGSRSYLETILVDLTNDRQQYPRQKLSKSFACHRIFSA